MKKVLIGCLIAFPVAAFAHGGRVASDGCHRDSQTGDRHCHNGAPVRADNVVSIPAPPLIPTRTLRVPPPPMSGLPYVDVPVPRLPGPRPPAPPLMEYVTNDPYDGYSPAYPRHMQQRSTYQHSSTYAPVRHETQTHVYTTSATRGVRTYVENGPVVIVPIDPLPARRDLQTFVPSEATVLPSDRVEPLSFLGRTSMHSQTIQTGRHSKDGVSTGVSSTDVSIHATHTNLPEYQVVRVREYPPLNMFPDRLIPYLQEVDDVQEMEDGL